MYHADNGEEDEWERDADANADANVLWPTPHSAHHPHRAAKQSR